jgi:hypothetical protein
MQVDEMTEAEKQARLRALVPGLKPEEWGAQTQDATKTAPVGEKKSVSFAEGTPSAKAEEEANAALENARKSRFEPTDYEGHVIESGDETSDEDGEQTMPGWRAKPSPRQKKKGPIDPAIYQLSEALKTGKVGPIEGWKDRSEQEDLEMSDAEEEDDVVEGDIDMEQEEEEFLKFARDALGIDEAMWTGMLEERKSRGGELAGCLIEKG